MKIICIDYDNTIVNTDQYDDIGSLCNNAKEVIEELKAQGYEIVIYSCRSNPIIKNQSRRYQNMVNTLNHYKIPYDRIDLSEKPIANFYIDDKAIRFDNWLDIKEKIIMKNFTGKSAMISSKIKSILKILPNVNGSILEFGVYGGHSLSAVLKYFYEKNQKINCWAFDSFQGLPKLTDKDMKYGMDTWNEGKFCCSLDECLMNLANVISYEYLFKNLHLIPGFYEESLTDSLLALIPKAGYVHIDCDLYESTLVVLNWILPLLQIGTYLVFDEYNFGEKQVWEKLAQDNKILYEKISQTEYQQIIRITNV